MQILNHIENSVDLTFYDTKKWAGSTSVIIKPNVRIPTEIYITFCFVKCGPLN